MIRFKSQNVKKSWFSLFINMFELQKYKNIIKCDGLKIIFLLYNKGVFANNNKIKKFIKNGYLKKILLHDDKINFLLSYQINIDKNPLSKSISLDMLDTFQQKYKNEILFRKFSPSAPTTPTAPITPKPTIQKPITPKTEHTFRGISKTITQKKETNPKLIKCYQNKLWISFGINNYIHLPILKNACNDAIDIAKFAQDKLYFNSKVYLNEQVTKNKIEQIIKDELYQTCEEYDLVVISFHGHGLTLNINNQNYGFIAPFDAPKNKTPANLISMEDLSNWTKYLKSNHVLLFMDCCFSGFTALRCDKERKKKSSSYTDYSLDKYLKTKSRIVINAGTHDQKVADGGWNNNSIFTGAFMSFPGFMNNIGSVSSIYNYLLETVPKYHSQTPTMGKLIGDQGGDIFLGL